MCMSGSWEMGAPGVTMPCVFDVCTGRPIALVWLFDQRGSRSLQGGRPGVVAVKPRHVRGRSHPGILPCAELDARCARLSIALEPAKRIGKSVDILAIKTAGQDDGVLQR